MPMNVNAIVVDSFTAMKTIEPLPGAVMQFICRAPSGMTGPLPTVWLSLDVARGLRVQLDALIRDLEADPRTNAARAPRQ